MASSALASPAVAASTLADLHREELLCWSTCWGLPDLGARVRIEVSGRLTRSLGRCEPAKGEIRIARWLREEAPELLPEVLCHELAHVAAYELYAGPAEGAKKRSALVAGLLGRLSGRRTGVERTGASAGAALRPHGREWKALMRRAGFAPRARIPEAQLPAAARARTAAGLRWDHSCPLCGARRIARRRMPQWRCRACREAGLAGELVMVELTVGDVLSVVPM
ncbi:MAG: SprT-like domain-containing protein [Deltaproteobacteria bacterium]|nr:SprT-like domain-containing protein [Deltaproteobacteria bacterium]MBW2417964.1 SprT-like domain-containing protein [Deltaproteobacteria bacterium]